MQLYLFVWKDLGHLHVMCHDVYLYEYSCLEIRLGNDWLQCINIAQREIHYTLTRHEYILRSFYIPDLSAILNHLRIQFPDKTDVEAVAKAILRLQKLYHIHPRNFASWRNISVLSVTESFDLAKFALKYNESRLALGWVNQILDMKANGKSNDKSNDAIYRFAAKAYEKV